MLDLMLEFSHRSMNYVISKHTESHHFPLCILYMFFRKYHTGFLSSKTSVIGIRMSTVFTSFDRFSRHDNRAEQTSWRSERKANSESTFYFLLGFDRMRDVGTPNVYCSQHHLLQAIRRKKSNQNAFPVHEMVQSKIQKQIKIAQKSLFIRLVCQLTALFACPISQPTYEAHLKCPITRLFGKETKWQLLADGAQSLFSNFLAASS